ncbi:hypothetical protein E2562_005866 [Oryza meyeriana var. granulata]|uniref:Uncharacterized protein n=1 Tax=Oryza meyeriana var. granulata TaxID=110450 RepID=A0A6G1DUV6_9ORYZ|nr:hypothetical protein E2562_005866 [Oryza meyeriana var. granulata]
MATTHPAAAATLKHGRHLLHRLVSSSSPSVVVVPSPVILHAAWITALVAVCLALCTIHSRRPPSSSSSSKAARLGAASARRRSGPGDEGGSAGGGGGGSTAAAAPPAKVSPTPSDTTKASGRVGETQAPAAAERWRGVADDHAVQDGAAAVPVTVIDVGTHGPIAPVFPAPDPLPPRRSLSVKHMRLVERLGARIQSTRWGRDGNDEDAGGGRGGEPAAEGSALWTKTIILGERCRVGDDEDGDAVVRWKSYRPRQPRSVPMTRSNSFAGVGSRGGASMPMCPSI